LWEQLTAAMVVILIVTALISALLGDYKDAIAILVIVVLLQHRLDEERWAEVSHNVI
jgi:hypothetical protein